MADQDEALNAEAEKETALPASPADKQTTEVPEDVSPETPEVPKKGAQSRIRELNSKVHSLSDRIAELTSPAGQQASFVPLTPQDQRPLVGADESIDGQELERRLQEREHRVLQQANQLIDFKTRQSATLERINRETVEVVSKFKELDPDSDSFDKELSDAVYEAVEAKVKSDPTASVKDFVAKQMKIFKREASREESQTQAVVAKQSAQSAIRPSQNKTSEKAFAEKSLEEMRAHLGYAE